MDEQFHMILGGKEILCTVERKRVKCLRSWAVSRTELHVLAPLSLSRTAVERVLQSDGQKLLDMLEQHSEQRQYPIHYTTGETVLYLGKYCRLSVERGSRDSVQVQGEVIRLLVRQPEQEALRKKTFDDWWECSCEKAVRNLCRAVYPVFAPHGIEFPEIRFRAMVSQWGNCRPQRGILTFNTRLLAAPVRCIEYVVMHEFTHFLYADHSGNFYGFLAQELPDWKLLEMQLRQVQTRL